MDSIAIHNLYITNLGLKILNTYIFLTFIYMFICL